MAVTRYFLQLPLLAAVPVVDITTLLTTPEMPAVQVVAAAVLVRLLTEPVRQIKVLTAA
jgi:hypothetical protein